MFFTIDFCLPEPEAGTFFSHYYNVTLVSELNFGVSKKIIKHSWVVELRATQSGPIHMSPSMTRLPWHVSCFSVVLSRQSDTVTHSPPSWPNSDLTFIASKLSRILGKPTTLWMNFRGNKHTSNYRWQTFLQKQDHRHGRTLVCCLADLAYRFDSCCQSREILFSCECSRSKESN